jgi:hypothetical protein
VLAVPLLMLPISNPSYVCNVHIPFVFMPMAMLCQLHIKSMSAEVSNALLLVEAIPILIELIKCKIPKAKS